MLFPLMEADQYTKQNGLQDRVYQMQTLQICQELLFCLDSSVAHGALDVSCIINFLPSTQALAWQNQVKEL